MNPSAPLLLLLLTACLASGAIVPRALWHFGGMVQCVQPDINALVYNNYGCWCGFGGKGTPRDEVDTCCMNHDNCYEASRKTPGCMALEDLPYFIEYEYTCSNQDVTCSATNDKCQAATCECDRVAAHCLAAHKYNPIYKNMDSKVCKDGAKRASKHKKRV